MSLENIILLACILVLIQIFIPIVIEQLIFKKINFSFLFSSRDEIIESSIYGYRSKRALNNLLETLPIFSLLVILSIFKEIDNSSLAAFWLILRARPYYSDLHNYYILIFDLIFYSSFVYGFIKRPKNIFSINIILLYILLSIALVGLTFADWSGRFSLYFLPFVMIFSSYGILIFIKKILQMVNKKWNNAF